MVILTHPVQFCEIRVGGYKFSDLLPYDIRLFLFRRRAVDAPVLIARKRCKVITHLPGEKRLPVLPCKLNISLTEAAQG